MGLGRSAGAGLNARVGVRAPAPCGGHGACFGGLPGRHEAWCRALCEKPGAGVGLCGLGKAVGGWSGPKSPEGVPGRLRLARSGSLSRSRAEGPGEGPRVPLPGVKQTPAVTPGGPAVGGCRCHHIRPCMPPQRADTDSTGLSRLSVRTQYRVLLGTTGQSWRCLVRTSALRQNVAVRCVEHPTSCRSRDPADHAATSTTKHRPHFRG